MVAITFALVIAVAIYAVFNTRARTSTGRNRVARSGWPVPVVGGSGYVGAQLAGVVVGAALIVAAFGDNAVGSRHGPDDHRRRYELLQHSRGGARHIPAGHRDHGARCRQAGARRLGGAHDGLAVAAAILLIGPLTGGSLNPARTFGPLVVSTSEAGHLLGHLPAYVIGPLLGGVLAAVAYDAVARPRMFDEVEPAQGNAGHIEASATVQPRAT